MTIFNHCKWRIPGSPLKGPFQQAFYTTTPTENISLERIRKTRQIQKIKTTCMVTSDYKINVKVVSRYIALCHDTYREPPYRYCIDISPYRLIPTGVTILHWIILGKLQTTSSLEPLMVICPNSTGMVPGWSPTKIVQMVLIGCISRSWGQKIGFQNAIFKNLLVWNYKAKSFHIWYIASSRGPLPKLFKLCPWGQNWPAPGVTILHWII